MIKSTRDPDLRIEDDQIYLTRGDRHYRIRGLEKNLSALQLCVSILATRDELVYLDTVDLVKARARNAFIKAASSELYCEEETIKKDVGRLLLQLEQLQLQQIEAAKRPRSCVPAMSDAARDEALTLLREPRLTERIIEDLQRCGMVGEPVNKLTGYLAAVSRKLKRPLAVVIQSSSSAGKTSLMDAILAMMPPEEQHHFSGMTGQSLFYLGKERLKHTILAISEDEGFLHGQTAYALKLLQSEGELRHVAVGKKSVGRMAAEVQPHLEPIITTLGRELRASIDFFEHQHDMTVSQIFVSGGTSSSELIRQMLQAELMTACNVWNPAANIQPALSPQQAAELDAVAPQLTVAIGAAVAAL